MSVLLNNVTNIERGHCAHSFFSTPPFTRRPPYRHCELEAIKWLEEGEKENHHPDAVFILPFKPSWLRVECDDKCCLCLRYCVSYKVAPSYNSSPVRYTHMIMMPIVFCWQIGIFASRTYNCKYQIYDTTIMHNLEIPLQVLPHKATKLCFPYSPDLSPWITIPTWWESSTPSTWEYFPSDDKKGLSTFHLHAYFPLLLYISTTLPFDEESWFLHQGNH